jgi:aminomethyltransferase
MTKVLQKTALYNAYKQAGARCIEFAGYEMPAWFSSMKEEHLAVRENAGVFDISHMGIFHVWGAGSDAFMQKLSTNSVSKALNSKMIYSMFLNESGMILDDVMFGKFNDIWHLIVNGSNKDKIANWMQAQKPADVEIKQKNSTHSLIAVQGQNAADILDNLLDSPVSEIGRFNIASTQFNSVDVLACRTGYTGEDGFELMIAHSEVETLFNTLIENEVTPCGLAARDTLRIEFGLPLYGQELSEQIHPLMTRYKWVVKFDEDFIGKQALLKLKEHDHLQAVGLELAEPLIARPNYKIIQGGYVSSGTLSPITGKSVALAFVPKNLAIIGSEVEVEIRKKSVAAKVVKVPFL